MTASDCAFLSAFALALVMVCVGIITGVRWLAFGPVGAWVFG